MTLHIKCSLHAFRCLVLLKATTSRVPKGLHRIKRRTEQGCNNSGTPGWQGDYIFSRWLLMNVGSSEWALLTPPFWRLELCGGSWPFGKRGASLLQSIVGRDSSVGIATRYGLDSPGIESR
jgi:hypothetical protein